MAEGGEPHVLAGPLAATPGTTRPASFVPELETEDSLSLLDERSTPSPLLHSTQAGLSKLLRGVLNW